jgi:arylsulfatase A-like enzyme
MKEFGDKIFPYPKNFNDAYEGREAAAKQDMTIDKTMLMHDDLKIGVDYSKRGMFGRMSDEEKKAYKAYYDKAEVEYTKIKHDPVEVVKWKYQRYLRDYLATARSMDRNIGRILDYLDQNGLTENTVVIYTSDQGFYMGEHGWFDKRFMYEESLRTPFVMRYPGKIKPGSEVDEMIVNIDFAPTLIQLAGIEVPKEMQGESFVGLLSGSGKKEWRKSMYYHYYEYPQPHQVAPHFGIRTERYKLIRFYGPHQNWELFDLKADPLEMKNLINEPSKGALINQLKSELRVLIDKYKDSEAVILL